MVKYPHVNWLSICQKRDYFYTEPIKTTDILHLNLTLAGACYSVFVSFLKESKLPEGHFNRILLKW